MTAHNIFASDNLRAPGRHISVCGGTLAITLPADSDSTASGTYPRFCATLFVLHNLAVRGDSVGNPFSTQLARQLNRVGNAVVARLTSPCLSALITAHQARKGGCVLNPLNIGRVSQQSFHNLHGKAAVGVVPRDVHPFSAGLVPQENCGRSSRNRGSIKHQPNCPEGVHPQGPRGFVGLLSSGPRHDGLRLCLVAAPARYALPIGRAGALVYAPTCGPE